MVWLRLLYKGWQSARLLLNLPHKFSLINEHERSQHHLSSGEPREAQKLELIESQDAVINLSSFIVQILLL